MRPDCRADEPDLLRVMRRAYRNALKREYANGIPLTSQQYDVRAGAMCILQELDKHFKLVPRKTKGRTAKLSASRPPKRGVVGKRNPTGPGGAPASRKRKR